MKPSSNLYRTALHNETLPDGNLTARQRALVDAVRHCSALSDFAAAPKEALTRINVCRIPCGLPWADANGLARSGIARARAELDRLEGVLKAYGPDAFVPVPEPVPARHMHSGDRHGILLNVLHWISSNGR